MPLTEEERAEVTRLLEAQGDGRKFRDPDFPHDESSLALEDREDVRAWRRPRKIASKPRLFVEGAACSDVEQGTLGDCWFLAAATAVAQYPDLIRQVIPDDQPLFGKDYHGILVFRFWKMGNWNSIYIDDKLPVDEYNGLVYGRCTTEYEFWLPLVEKAFAKFHGNYENIVGGFPSEAFLSLTGYIVEESYLSEANIRDLYRLFAVELKNNSIIACATESTRRRGLVGDHAYTVTGVGSLRLGSGLVRLVRVRNPHASTEWQGAWADSDPNWNEIDGKTLDSLGYENKDDGQFWIKMSHFKKHFPDIYLAARLPDFGDDYATASRQFYSVNHSWETGVNSGGGNVEDTEKFVTNPQYTLIIRDTDCPGSVSEEEEEEEEQEEGLEEDVETCDVVVELIQEQDRAKYDNLNFIGITIFKVSDDSLRRLGVDDMNGLEPHQGSVEHVECSAVVTRLHLTPGNYIVVPSILEPDVSRSFLMRVYSRKPIAFIC